MSKWLHVPPSTITTWKKNNCKIYKAFQNSCDTSRKRTWFFGLEIFEHPQFPNNTGCILFLQNKKKQPNSNKKNKDSSLNGSSRNGKTSNPLIQNIYAEDIEW